MDKNDKIVLKLIFWCFLAMLSMAFMITPVFASEQGAGAGMVSDKLVNALVSVELRGVKGDSNAIGDVKLKHKAYGCLQVRQPCVDDVNKRFGTKHKAQDCLGNRELSVWICQKYLEIYATEKRLGRKPTDEDCARIWNGGPNGFKKSSTDVYWAKVQKALEKS